jgi:leucyl-tRNA synthetase
MLDHAMMRSRPSSSGPATPDAYDHRAVEAKWRRRWEASGSYETPLEAPQRPFYNLMMFPYPSAEGLHVGNVYAYTGADVYGRWRRLKGDTVFQPIGFDAFGIHSENHALHVGEHPSRLVPRNVAHFKRQLQRLGTICDWGHEINTTDPAYYRWTQWLFLRLYHAGLAEQREGPANWCPSCRTVLADEQVLEGHCERCDTRVEQRVLLQWFLKITRYAQALLDGLDQLDWSERTITAQRNWIGRSTGALVRFALDGSRRREAVAFTTRPDTIYGATFLVVGADHPQLEEFAAEPRRAAVAEWRAQLPVRAAPGPADPDLGIELGTVAIHPLSGERLPVWAAPYVAGGYSTGVVMAVPAHDERDHAFATAHGLRIVQVVSGRSERAIEAVIDRLERLGRGERSVQYRLRDWLISRQRYWGPPIPVVYCPAEGVVPVPESDLPVLLPHVEDFRPLGTGVSPLASAQGWVATPCPRCGSPARRETDVSDNFLDSAWYFLRYPSSDLDDRPFDRGRTWTWLPVDSYIGGNEHAVGHLLYARFIMRALHDLGLVPDPEPFRRFRAHGLIVRDGAKMSKSRGNVVDPDRYVERHGADALRLYLMFMGPYTEGGDFREQGLAGVTRFIERVWRAVQGAASEPAGTPQPGGTSEPGGTPEPDGASELERERRRHRLIAAVDERIAALACNTAIALLMSFARELDREAAAGCARRADAVTLLKLLAPFAPHVTEELWERIGEPGSVHDAGWPEHDPALAAATLVTVPVALNGKRRATLEVAAGTPPDELERRALALPRIAGLLAGRVPRRVVAVRDRMVNLVV